MMECTPEQNKPIVASFSPYSPPRRAELDVEAGGKAAHLAALNALAVARQHLGSLDKVTRIVRLGVSVATSGDVRDQPKVADAASELLQDCRNRLNQSRTPLIDPGPGSLR